MTEGRAEGMTLKRRVVSRKLPDVRNPGRVPGGSNARGPSRATRPPKTINPESIQMKLSRYLLSVCLVSRAAVAFAQSSDDGEIVCLSPFEVSTQEDRGYRSAETLAARAPNLPVTLIKPADAVIIEFALSNSADKQEVRNKELTDSIDALGKEVRKIPGLKLENREVRLTTGDRRKSIVGKGGAVTSFANVVVLADLSADVRLYDRVKQVRDLIDDTKLRGDTKVIDGPVGLFIRRPNQYRQELLTKIFEDLEVVRKGVGPEFEVLVSGLAGGVQVRACSERELELWLDYSFTIHSIRYLTTLKK